MTHITDTLSPTERQIENRRRFIAHHVATVERCVKRLRERRAWIAAASEHNGGVGRFYGDQAELEARDIARARKHIHRARRELRALLGGLKVAA